MDLKNRMTEDKIPYRDRLNLIRNGMAEKTTKAKEKKPLRRLSIKKAAADKAEKEAGIKPPGKLELDKWFDDIKERHWKDNYCPCMECGIGIPRLLARYATAHLLPKKLFKSVATHPLNYLILGANGSPKHPLYCKTDTIFVEWNAGSAYS